MNEKKNKQVHPHFTREEFKSYFLCNLADREKTFYMA